MWNCEQYLYFEARTCPIPLIALGKERAKAEILYVLWCDMKVRHHQRRVLEQIHSVWSNPFEWWAKMWPISLSMMISVCVVILSTYLGQSYAVCLRYRRELRLRYSNLHVHFMPIKNIQMHELHGIHWQTG